VGIKTQGEDIGGAGARGAALIFSSRQLTQIYLGCGKWRGEIGISSIEVHVTKNPRNIIRTRLFSRIYSAHFLCEKWKITVIILADPISRICSGRGVKLPIWTPAPDINQYVLHQINPFAYLLQCKLHCHMNNAIGCYILLPPIRNKCRWLSINFILN
jgi:hypothetical protein